MSRKLPLICVRMEEGRDFFEGVREIVEKYQLTSGVIIHALGQFRDVELGFYDRDERKFRTKSFDGPFEITNLSGNIGFLEGEVVTHVHVVLGDKHFGAISGHLNKATVTSTLEMFILSVPVRFIRRLDEETGLKLLHFVAEETGANPE